MKNVVDFASGYASGIVLMLLAVVPWNIINIIYGKNWTSKTTELTVFLHNFAAAIIGIIISIICLIIILVKMNGWQKIGIVASAITIALTFYHLNR